MRHPAACGRNCRVTVGSTALRSLCETHLKLQLQLMQLHIVLCPHALCYLLCLFVELLLQGPQAALLLLLHVGLLPLHVIAQPLLPHMTLLFQVLAGVQQQKQQQSSSCVT